MKAEILGERHLLEPPVDWAPVGKSRLWHFTLHYFDWAVELIAAAIEAEGGAAKGGGPRRVAKRVFELMTSWTHENPYAKYDAWHPYPTAKRLVAWTYLMTSFPDLLTPEIERSHWLQVRYLHHNVEWHAGGNHLLQDLCALVMAASRYESVEADRIRTRALRDLSEQLPRQLTADGCHYELSSAYHLQTIVMVTEAVAALLSTGVTPPKPLLQGLSLMTGFARRMRLGTGTYPQWNDSATNSVAPIDVVIRFAELVLGEGERSLQMNSPSTDGEGLPFPYSQAAAAAAQGPDSAAAASPAAQDRSGPVTGALEVLEEASGYHVLRSGRFEVAFDAAHTGASDLPGHGHADCLNVDVHFDGVPLVVETGTSTYEANRIRAVERGTAAHNTVTIDGQDQSEMWGSFRVHRMARTFYRMTGETEGWHWASAAHDGYRRPPVGITHARWVGVDGSSVVVLDQLTPGGALVTELPFCLRFHLAPGVDPTPVGDGAFLLRTGGLTGASEPRDPIEIVATFAASSRSDQVRLLPESASGSWLAPGFGVRVPRSTLELAGTLGPQGRRLVTVFSRRGTTLEVAESPESVTLTLNGQVVPLPLDASLTPPGART